VADVAAVVAELRAAADPARLDGMARVGIRTDRAIGVSVPNVRRIARRHRGDHALALALWATGIHEARLLAPMVADPGQATDAELDAWVAELDSWDTCDGLCSSLLVRMPQRWGLVERYAAREPGFEKRAGFALLATLAVHDRAAPDDAFQARLALIERHAPDPRNEVRKAVNWALRQIGKRNAALHADAIACGERILAAGPRSARWVASDALRELRSRSPPP
jgi:3-methyladenine DNA glycosylase AlkD